MQDRVGQAVATELRALRDSFRSPALRRLQLAGLETSVAEWGSALVLGIYAYGRGGAGAVGLMALLRTLPAVPAAPPLTFLADRRSRRTVLVATNAVRGVLVAATAAVVAAGLPLAATYLLVVFLSIAGPAYRPAQAALFPLLARSPAELASANVSAAMMLNVGFLAGSLAVGVLLTVGSVSVVLGVFAAMFALSLLPLYRLERDTPPVPDPDARPVGDVVEGFETVVADPELRLLVAMGGVLALTVGALDVLVVVAAFGLLGVGETGVGYLNVGWGVGSVAGGAAVVGLLARGRLASGLALGALLVGGSSALIGIVGTATIAFLALGLVGVGETLVDVVDGTLLQRLTPDHVLSRVFGVLETVGAAAFALGSLAAGLFASAVGVRAALFAAGLLMPAVVLLRASRLSSYEAGAPVAQREYGLLRAHRIFAPLPVATVEWLARSLVEVRPEPGEAVVRQGDVGDRFYLIAEGDVDVFYGSVHAASIGAGDGFGEIALLRDVPRTSTVRARAGVVLLALERDAFLDGVNRLSRSRRSADSIAEERLRALPASKDANEASPP